MLALLPFLIPLVTAITTACVRSSKTFQRSVSLLGCLGLLLVGVVLVERTGRGEVIRCVPGGWPSAFGIEYCVDRLSAALVLVAAIMLLATQVFEFASIGAQAWNPRSAPLVHGLLAGVGASFCAADFFHLYVGFEILLMTSTGLSVVGGQGKQLDGALKSLVLSLIGTFLLLCGVALLYRVTGHLNFGALRAVDLPPLGVLSVAMMALAFLIKAGAFPFFSWLPASYPTLSIPTLALFAGLLTKVGVYATLRLFGDVFAGSGEAFSGALTWIGSATMLLGVAGAAYHYDLRAILSFHIISQIGYLIAGVGFDSREGHAATLFYTLHHIVVKTSLFLIAGVLFAVTGTFDLRRMGGLLKSRPGLALVFLVPALSLIGVPPFSGFWAKFVLLSEALRLESFVVVGVGLFVSGLTLYSMLKVWVEAFWKPRPEVGVEPALELPGSLLAIGAVLTLGVLTCWMGFLPEAFLVYCRAAAAALGRGLS